MRKVFARTLSSLAVTLLAASAAAAVCERQVKHKLLFQGTTFKQVPAQVLVAENREELKKILRRLEFGPFHHDGLFDRFDLQSTMRKFLVVIGHPRNNGCRHTRFLCVQQTDRHGLVQAAIAEIRPGCGCICTDNVQGSAVFIVAVPHWVRSAELVSVHRVHHCQDCDPGCSLLSDSVEGVDGITDIQVDCP